MFLAARRCPPHRSGGQHLLRHARPAGDARTLAGERVALREGRWLLLVAEQPLVDETIGCAHWSVLFCDNPWMGHAFGAGPGS